MDPSPVDNLKFPGEPGFTGLPNLLADDTVRYEVRVLDEAQSDAAIRERLRAVQSHATQTTRRLLKDYVWQREGFRLELARDQGKSYLTGSTGYGDAAEDEWLVVYLLRELSRQFADAWIRVTDADGEFLLSEAAGALPKWLNPDVAENRVWINQGALLIIPQASAQPAKPETKFISLPQALGVLRRPRSELLHSVLIEEEAFFRLRNYPAQIQQNLHCSLITIPRRLAFILHQLPTSIAPATEAFYLRDPIALRPLQEPSSNALIFPPEDLVTARVKFNRVGFAQVRSQHFQAPPAWVIDIKDNKDVDGANVPNEKSEERREIGMKVSCGFEMLISDPQNQDKQVVREIKLLLEDLLNGDESLPTDHDVESWGTTEDDDAWMDIDFRDFEEELAGKPSASATRFKDKGTNGWGDQTAHENLQKMVSRFEEFLNADMMADDDDEDEDEDDDSEEPSSDGEDKDASFTEDEFTAMMREMMSMPPETMQELMGPQAGKATGLAESDHPDFTQMDSDTTHNERLARLFGEIAPSSNGKRPKEPAQGSPKEAIALSDLERRQYRDRLAKAFQEMDLLAPGKELEEEEGENTEEPSDDEEEIKQLSALMEAELRRSGALSLSEPGKGSKGKSLTHVPITPGIDAEDSGEDSEGELLDEDYNLVSNLLQSFKGQAGASGPSGNLLGMMGLRVPRDEGESDDDSKELKPTPNEAKGKGKGKGKGKAIAQK